MVQHGSDAQLRWLVQSSAQHGSGVLLPAALMFGSSWLWCSAQSGFDVWLRCFAQNMAHHGSGDLLRTALMFSSDALLSWVVQSMAQHGSGALLRGGSGV